MSICAVIVVSIGLAAFALEILAAICQSNEACQFNPPDRLTVPTTPAPAQAPTGKVSVTPLDSELVYTCGNSQCNGPADDLRDSG